jgi:MoxR-like ATPase
MVQAGVPVTRDISKSRAYGSEDEVDLLEKRFRVPGGPVDRPYRAVWEGSNENAWRDDKYPGRSLQRMRTDRVKDGTAFLQKAVSGQPKHSWAILPGCGAALKSLGRPTEYPIRLIDLAIWFGRNKDVQNLAELMSWLLKEYNLDQGDLIGTVYSRDVPDHYKLLTLSPSPLTQDEYAAAVGSSPEPHRFVDDMKPLVARIEAHMRARHFHPHEGLVLRVLFAWLRGDIVVLVGQPGTGKTSFVGLLSEALRRELGVLTTVWIPVRPDFDEGDFLGYERLDGTAELREFVLKVLRTEDPLGPHLVILEEFNLATLENYLSSVLVATTDPGRRLALPGGVTATLPVDTFFIATCNSYVDEPETRLRLTFASKRRCSIITMQNVLYQNYQQGGLSTIVPLAMDMIAQERADVTERGEASLATTFDKVRRERLDTVQRSADLSPEVREALERVCQAILESPSGQGYLTLALLKSMAVAIALTERSAEAELGVLGGVLGEKLVHQIRGSKNAANELRGALTGLSDLKEVEQVLEVMESGPGDELLPML